MPQLVPMAKKKVKKKTAKKSVAKKAVKKKVVKKTTAKKAAKKVTKKKVAKKAAPKKAAKKVTKAKVTKKVAKVKAVKKAAAKKSTGKKESTVQKALKAVSKAFIGEKPVSKKAKKPVKQKEAPVKAKQEELEEDLEEEIDDIDLDEIEEEIVLTDAEGRRYCRVKDCDQLSQVDGYCRYHYLLFWKKIQIRKKILVDGKLEKYIEELTSRFPIKFLEVLRKDLSTEKEFLAVIHELELDEQSEGSEDFDDEVQRYNEEVQGIVAGAGDNDDHDDDY